MLFTTSLQRSHQTAQKIIRASSSLSISSSKHHSEKYSVLKSEYSEVEVQAEPFNVTLLNALKEHALEQPNRPALINVDNTNDKVSFDEFLTYVHSISAYLESKGFGHGDVAGIVLPNSWQYLAIFLGSLMQGGCVTGANVALTPEEIARQLNHSKCKIAFCTDTFVETLLSVKEKCPQLQNIVSVSYDGKPSIDKKGVENFESVISFRPNQPYVPNSSFIRPEHDLLLLPYSSGTTGLPKGVELTHKNYGTMIRIFHHHLTHRILRAMDPGWDWKKEYNSLILPFHHIYGFALGLNSLLAGSCGVIPRKFDFEQFLKLIQDYRLRYVMIVPPLMVYLAKSSLTSKYDLSSLKFIMTGAAPAGKDICDRVLKKLPHLEQIAQGYGMTEASMATHLPIYGIQNSTAAGKLIANMEMKIVDVNTREPVKLGETGELCIRGPTIMKGYLNNPKATADTVDGEGWLLTGDVGYVDESGWTYIVDRIKELIKVKGFQVAPAELEDILLSHPKIKDCAVIGVPCKIRGEVPRAFVVKADENLTAQEVKDFVQDKVAEYKSLRGGVEFINEIPKSPAGKILRRLLRDNYK